MEGGRKRKALSDCTNTIHSTIATTTTNVSKNPSLPSVFNRLLDGGRRKAVHSSNSKTSEVATTGSSNQNVVASSASVNFSGSVALSSTPVKNSSLLGTGEREIVEPCSVYGRRRTSVRRKSKGKEVAGSTPISFQYTRDDKKEDGIAAGPHKSCPGDSQKGKQPEPVHAMSSDFIEKQRAYFAEIDAFELPEEEVESADQLE